MTPAQDRAVTLILDHGYFERAKGGMWVSPDGSEQLHFMTVYRLEELGLVSFVGPSWKIGGRVIWARIARKQEGVNNGNG